MAGTTKARRLTLPVLLKVKVIFWALPSWTASRPLGSVADALSLPPRISEPPAGTVRLWPLAGFSSAEVPLLSRVTDWRVWSVRPELNTVAEITAGPVDWRSGWVMTRAFWILMSPTLVAALSGLISRVWALFPAPQAASEAIEKTMAEAARAPRRRLLLTAAATP